ncbi:hypothetical protein SLEP1_g56863 [Rubroshorea leprosula]|uniref:NADH dehydrogenase subunit 4 n=1 Tax=Rubroshorea leprosula TaxID=152421 RepID=A0AAV5MK01_9ROSI|nr:hypothetical protein SLEP1_g56863 [Rubroshorea leprosula]
MFVVPWECNGNMSACLRTNTLHQLPLYLPLLDLIFLTRLSLNGMDAMETRYLAFINLHLTVLTISTSIVLLYPSYLDGNI